MYRPKYLRNQVQKFMCFPDRGASAPCASCMSMPLVRSEIADIWVTDTNPNRDPDPNNDPNLTLGLGLATMLLILSCSQRLSWDWFVTIMS